MGAHKGQATRHLHLVHHRQQLTDLLHLVAPLTLAMLVPLVVLPLQTVTRQCCVGEVSTQQEGLDWQEDAGKGQLSLADLPHGRRQQ